jgi:hypothetical protein
MDLFWVGGEGPKDIPSWVYVYMLTTFKLPPEALTNLRSVQKTGFQDSKPVTFIRIYDSTNDEALKIKDFNYLDKYEQLILFEGYWEKDYKVFIESRKG